MTILSFDTMCVLFFFVHRKIYVWLTNYGWNWTWWKSCSMDMIYLHICIKELLVFLLLHILHCAHALSLSFVRLAPIPFFCLSPTPLFCRSPSPLNIRKILMCRKNSVKKISLSELYIYALTNTDVYDNQIKLIMVVL